MEKFDKSIINKIGETITTKGKAVTLKAKDLAEIASLKSQISTCENVMKKNYMEIGKRYYELHKDAWEEIYDEECRAIANAQNGIDELDAKIQEIKGI